MSFWRNLGRWMRGESAPQASRVYVVPDSVEEPPDEAQHAPPPPAPASGHRERRDYAFRQVGSNEVIPEQVESWDRHGNVMEGRTLDVRVLTASMQIVQPGALQTICSVCGKAEDTELRSAVSQRTLCRTCARSFILPTGETITISPDEEIRLLQEFDTWAAFDTNRRSPLR